MCMFIFTSTIYTHILYLYITYYFTSELNIHTWICQPTVGGLGRCFGFLGSPSSALRVGLEVVANGADISCIMPATGHSAGVG